MKQYSKYKPSGIQWIGDIPAHWNLKPLKRFSDITLGKMLTPEDKGDYILKPYLRAQNLQWYKPDVNDVNEMWFSEYELKQYRVFKNDLLVSEGGEVGRTCIWNNELPEVYFQNSVNRVKVNHNSSPNFYLFQFVLMGFCGHFNAIVNKVSIAHLTKEKLKEVIFINPPLPEQTAIANYLDHKTTKIDNAIAKKQQLIELLNEELKSIINEAVTNGIGSDTKKWITKRLKYFFNLITTKACENRPKVGLENIESKTGKFIETESDFEGEGIEFEINDILFGKLRPYLAKVYLADFAGSAVGDFYALRCKEALFPQYAKYKLLDHWFIEISNSSTFGAKMPRVSWDFLANLEISIPPIQEQHRIVEYIEAQSLRIDCTISKINREIELLAEYRQSLIFEAVTGKIKVDE